MIFKKVKKGQQFLYNGDAVWVVHQKSAQEAVIKTVEVPVLADEVIIVNINELKDIKTFGSKIKPVSDNREKELKIYSTLRKTFLGEHKFCEADLPGCKKIATEVHHSAGRISNKLVDITTFKALCNSCHRWVELNPKKAKEFGLSVDRL